MNFSNQFIGQEQQIVDLFLKTFTASENEDEGTLIGNLVNNLLNSTVQKDISVFTAEDNGQLIGCAIFTRVTYSNDSREVFILSPMAVATSHQGLSIGQKLLTHALTVLGDSGVDVAITYGDPKFYGKIGFVTVSEKMIPSPLPLSQPEGWVAQSLTSESLTPLKGDCTCVASLNDPVYW